MYDRYEKSYERDWKRFGERLNFKKLIIDTDNLSDKLKEVETHLNNIHMRSQNNCMCFPSTRLNSVEDLREGQTTLISNVESLIESINTLKMEYDDLQAYNDSAGRFVANAMVVVKREKSPRVYWIDD